MPRVSPHVYRLLRQSFETSGTGDPRPENSPILRTHANDVAFAATLQTSHTRGHAQSFGSKYSQGPVSGPHHGFARGRRRMRRQRPRPARTRPPARGHGFIVAARIMEIHQERQTLAGFAAFQAELSPLRAFVPAAGHNSQPPSGQRRESSRQVEVLDPRPLWFHHALLAEFGRHRLPYFLPRDRSESRVRRDARRLGRKFA